MMKKRLLVVVCCMLLAFCLSACNGDAKTPADSNTPPVSDVTDENKNSDEPAIKVGMCNSSDFEIFCTSVQNAFKDIVAEQSPDWQVYYASSDFDAALELQAVETFIAQGVDIIVIQCADQIGSASSVAAANEAGIPIITMVNTAESGERTYVGASNYYTGEVVGSYMKDLLPENANVVIMDGDPGSDVGRERINGFLSSVMAERDDITVLAEMAAEWDRAKGMALMEDWMQAYPNIDYVFSASDTMALGAYEAAKGAGIAEQIFFTGVDGIEDGIRSVAEGGMKITMFYNFRTVAELTYNTIKEIVYQGIWPHDNVYIDMELVTQENAQQYLDTYF